MGKILGEIKFFKQTWIPAEVCAQGAAFWIWVVMNVDTNYNVQRLQNTTNGPVRKNAEQTCQDILEASILAALPSDKHMPGMEPRGEGKTTDAIQSTPFLLCEPG